jgi:F0F1-type ATP synthase assembly protein I
MSGGVLFILANIILVIVNTKFKQKPRNSQELIQTFTKGEGNDDIF